MARTYRLVVGPAEAGTRLDRFLVRHLPASVSRSMIQRSIVNGAVTVDGRGVKVHRTLHAADVVVARCDTVPAASTKRDSIPQPIALEIIFEDPTLLIINKPPGLVVHPAPGHWDGTLVNAVLWHLQTAQGSRLRAQGDGPQPGAPSPQPSLSRAGIVHRLDKDTSGLLIVAKTEVAQFALSKQLKDHAVSRRYLALVEGSPPMNRGTIKAAIGRHQRNRKLMTVRQLGGRDAVTHYRVIKRFEVRSSEFGVRSSGAGRRGHGPQRTAQSPQRPLPFTYSLLEVMLETGRTHQVRVHLAYLGYPVLGDATYGRRSAATWATFGISRQLLHAVQLRLHHPKTGASLTFAAPPPADMVQWLPGVEKLVDAVGPGGGS